MISKSLTENKKQSIPLLRLSYTHFKRRVRFEITVIPLILSQITVVQTTFFIKLQFLFLTRVWNTEYRAKFTQMIEIFGIKFT